MVAALLTEHIPELRMLVTGGSGFLGAYTAFPLLQEGADQVAIVSCKPSLLSPDDNLKDRLSYHAANVADETQIKELFAQLKQHAVIYTAALRHADTAATYNCVTIDGTYVLLKCTRNCPETRVFVYTASDSACIHTQTLLTKEHAELYTESDYLNIYALSKALANRATLVVNLKKLASAVICIPTLYSENDPNLIPQLLSSVYKPRGATLQQEALKLSNT
jgi:sterol-4alpha-carboxylate 3-dehydrogenase (decarboxylating)